MAAYLTYSDYVAMGGEREETDFERASFRANALITKLTHGRIENETPVRIAAKYAAFDIINMMIADSESGADSRLIASMSNDGMTVTYADTGTGAAQVNASRYAGIVRSYLQNEYDVNGVMLLYAGF